MKDNTEPEMTTERNEILQLARGSTLKLLAYCQAHNWAGVDPYDAVNSRVFKMVPLLDSRIPRLVLTQFLKRSPWNFRGLLQVPPTQNPKAVGLFLASVLKLSKLGLVEGDELVRTLAGRLETLRSPDNRYWCWGYSFPWQTRSIVVPRGAPNLVCTTFVANALLDAYEDTGESRYLQMAVSSANYIRNDLYWTDGSSLAGLAYPLPTARSNVHNGNLLGAALLCRVAKHNGDHRLIEAALKVTRFSASRQREDGSWYYGEFHTQQWIDNFHTGYNLCGLRSINGNLQTLEFDSHIQRGFEFYKTRFFRSDGAAKYFHDRTYPIDVHCIAQSIITLLTFRDLDASTVTKASLILRWAMDHMWDERGFFYYRRLRLGTIRTSYMRWSQAWMLLALSTFLSELKTPIKGPKTVMSTASIKA
jgi:hypothetical protein